MSEEKQTPVGLIVAIVAVIAVIALVVSSKNQQAAEIEAEQAAKAEAERAAVIREMKNAIALENAEAERVAKAEAERVAKAEAERALAEANLPGNRLRARPADTIQELVGIWCGALGGKTRAEIKGIFGPPNRAQTKIFTLGNKHIWGFNDGPKHPDTERTIGFSLVFFSDQCVSVELGNISDLTPQGNVAFNTVCAEQGADGSTITSLQFQKVFLNFLTTHY